ncbi:unnamed protein product [Chrysodeixis includens]|uniref:microsomal epoxide hydrolase n=1 Tax=Chrysodeixis includens TaxID=689277 RepID=A0A9P0C0C9_CHRIL|nr:unnamed protein product [Chrysodeixis includens]
MGKKDKKKENDSAKVSKKKEVRKEQRKDKGVNIVSAIPFLILVGLSMLAYRVYDDLTHIPATPELDFNRNWGPNASEPKDTSIRPYRIVFSDAMEGELRWLFEVYRRTLKKKSFEDTAWTYGVHTDAFAKIFSHWVFKYSFRDRERYFNKFEQFKTNVQGLDIHYVHVKPKVDKNVMVVPLLLLHSWPGSVLEFYEAIPLLTAARPGYNFVFEVIVPSLPGFGFSQGAVRPGLSPNQIAVIMRNLMQRLGHKYYYVEGNGIGHNVGADLATIFPNEVLGFHSSSPVVPTNRAYLTWILGALWPTFVANGDADKLYPLGDKIKFYLEESGYLHLQATKPDTIGIALQDSPVGLASYILDRMMIMTDPANKFDPDGGLDKYFSYDKLLDNIMMYYVSGSITTSLRFFKENFDDYEVENAFARIPTPVPTWGLRLKNAFSYSPDFVLRWKYPNLVGTTSYDFGGQFIAFERPKEFVEDVFKAVKAFLELKK